MTDLIKISQEATSGHFAVITGYFSEVSIQNMVIEAVTLTTWRDAWGAPGPLASGYIGACMGEVPIIEKK